MRDVGVEHEAIGPGVERIAQKEVDTVRRGFGPPRGARARLAIDPAAAGYAAGQLPLVSVLEAVQALWLVQADLITADTELGLAWARLGRAIGSYEGILR